MIELSENLITGVDIVDNQHRELIKRTAELIEACSNDVPTYEIEKILDFLADYVLAHFSCEENMQEKVSYPMFSEHKEQHDSFIKSFVEMRRDFMKHGSSEEVVNNITETVVDWLIDHIGDSDVTFAKYYRNNI